MAAVCSYMTEAILDIQSKYHHEILYIKTFSDD
jgi:hypothetical protein